MNVYTPAPIVLDRFACKSVCGPDATTFVFRGGR